MPKKNAFFFFMRKRKSEMQAAGIQLTGGLNEVAKLVDSEWQNLPEFEKQMFKEMANAYNEHLKIEAGKSPLPQPSPGPSSAIKKNSRGESVDELQAQAQMGVLEEEETRRLLTMITSEYDAGSIPIVLIEFSCYEDSPGQALVPAELGMCAFSVNRGIFDNYSTLIDPKIASPNFQTAAKRLALPEPNYDKRLQNYYAIVKNMGLFISGHSKCLGDSYLFCLDKDIKITRACMEWLFRKAGEGFIYKLLSLDLLIQHISCLAYMERSRSEVTASLENFHISSSVCDDDGMDMDNSNYDQDDDELPIKQDTKEVPKDTAMELKNAVTGSYVAKPGMYPFIGKGIFFHQSHVGMFLQADNYAYYEELACLYHMERRDGVYYCPMNVVNRYAFCLLDVLVGNFGVSPIPGDHYPNMNTPQLEISRRRTMLRPWAMVNYSELASAEKAKDVDLMEAEEAMGPEDSKACNSRTNERS